MEDIRYLTRILLSFGWMQISTGMNCDFAQDVVAINTTEKKCCTIGELNKRAVVTPDIDSVLNSLEDL